MGEITGISWTDHTFNPWIGCTKVSPGCDNCYAESQDHRWGHDRWGKGKLRTMTSDSNWKQPLKWNRDAQSKFGRKATVFCASLADVMDDEAPEGGRERLWELIDQTPNLIWQLLTKRPHRYERYLPAEFKHGNVWLGTTAENQEFYDVRWPILSTEGIRRKLTRWISYEPALGPLRLTNGHGSWPEWVIFGGESGAGHRPCDVEWAEALRRECLEELDGQTKFFVKQMGARTPALGKALIPAHLLIQQFPERA